MKKHPFTADGIQAFHSEMSMYDEERLVNEAVVLAEDCLGYLNQKFEIDVSMLEAMRMLDTQQMFTLGWCLAIAVINRQPITFADNIFSIASPVVLHNPIYTFTIK
ncbi:hypothetical protein GCM10007424_00080 [Flavobacterium suaedae]|uniref:Uncharacterized protein n=1 Tax=Flavobacterium suaedae TaxID=1767027 RepID=A0ABQ1JAP0_9FLAO|nr:hypothetical protein [Flavobacterium suaedae]GGB64215.1 hypothetical protein GCM10007424_00080 [Flavobacterium suaedae]